MARRSSRSPYKAPRQIHSGVTNRSGPPDSPSKSPRPRGPVVKVPAPDDRSHSPAPRGLKPAPPEEPWHPGEGRKRNLRNQAGESRDTTVSGHSIYVHEVLRDFFGSRPHTVLLDVFREVDADGSGTLDAEEFEAALKKVNIQLTQKDMQTLFRNADKDGSGVLEFDEFYNRTRHCRLPKALDHSTSASCLHRKAAPALLASPSSRAS